MLFFDDATVLIEGLNHFLKEDFIKKSTKTQHKNTIIYIILNVHNPPPYRIQTLYIARYNEALKQIKHIV